MEQVLNSIMARLTAMEELMNKNKNNNNNIHRNNSRNRINNHDFQQQNNNRRNNRQGNARVFTNSRTKNTQQQPRQNNQNQRYRQHHQHHHQRQQQNQQRHQPAQPAVHRPAHQPEHQTDNTAFSAALKRLYRGTQLRHHANNWQHLPKPVDKKVDELFEFLSPPAADGELNTKLESLKLSIKHDIKMIISEHINTQLETNTKELCDTYINDTDRTAAKNLAQRVINKKYMRKVNTTLRDEWLNADVTALGGNWPNLLTIQQQQQQETVQQLTATAAAAMDTNPAENINKRKRTISSPSIPVSNSFSALATDEVDEDTAIPDDDDVTVPMKRTFKAPDPVTRKRASTISLPDDSAADSCDTWSVTSEIIEPSSPISMSSQPAIIERKRIYERKKECKQPWKIQFIGNNKRIIIADSNMRPATHIPDDTELHVYPGAYFKDIHTMISKTDFPSSVKEIVIAAGINHRSWNFAASTKPELGKLQHAILNKNKKGYFVGISVSQNLSPQEKANIDNINQAARSKFSYIQPIPSNQVIISNTDTLDKIHHDLNTVNKI